MGIRIQNEISKFSKTKNQTQKRPPKVPKNQKHIYGGLKSKSFIKQTPQKWEIWFKMKFRNFQKPKIKPKKDPLKLKKSKTFIRSLQIKKFYKTDHQKVGILIQNAISKFSKTTNQTQKRPPKVKKIKNIYKEASNQKDFQNLLYLLKWWTNEKVS